MSDQESFADFISGSEESFISPRKARIASSAGSEGSFTSPRKNRIASSSGNESISTEPKTSVSGSEIIIESSDDETPEPEKPPSNSKNVVSQSEYNKQKAKVLEVERDLTTFLNLSRTLDYSKLQDNGARIKARSEYLKELLKTEKKALDDMEVRAEPPVDKPSTSTASDARPKFKSLQEMMQAQVKNQTKQMTWDEIQQGASAVQPKTFGKKAMATYNTQKSLTLNRLQQIHGSMSSRPAEKDEETDPDGLKVPLMPHQRRALKWLLWREKQRPSGGILADDMGLGKTLTMISLMLKSMEQEEGNSDEEDQSDDEESEEQSAITKNVKYDGGTLVICPASLINQWSGELENRTRRGLASFDVYHGPRREPKPKSLSAYNMVITTYSIVKNESERKGALFRIKWRRVILDEAHQIRNYKTKTSLACCMLSAKSRWALTGTPVHNTELDMYSLLKFLRCSPFDDLQLWKRWVGDKTAGGQERLHALISSLMLRRTKLELQDEGNLECLPERKWELITLDLEKTEMDVYQRVLLFSRTLFAQFLHQRAEKNQDYADVHFVNSRPNEQYSKMRDKLLKMNNVKEVKQHQILVLLLRLRQICNHPFLIKAMLNEENTEDLGSDDEEEVDLLEQLNKLSLNDDRKSLSNKENAPVGVNSDEPVNLNEASKGFLNPSNPVFTPDHLSTKIKKVKEVLKERVLKVGDKAILVSNWPSYLALVGKHLKEDGIEFLQLDGSIPVNKRMNIVDSLNDPKHKVRILLLSLTAGGVGLNLVGANHLFLLDLHWNPQLENQAQDRIYRVGQKKNVYVYKFMANNTIEERIKALQDRKLDIANGMLTGSKAVKSSKLSLQDLRMLFDM